MKLADGVHKVDGLRVSNSYLVELDDGLLLVDTGMSRTGGGVVAFIESLGRKPADLRYIVLTHCDLDHIGGAARLKELTGASVAIHELDAPVLAGEHGPDKGGRAMRALFCLMRVRHVAPDSRLKDGEAIAGFHVMHVPGHTRGSLALWREDGLVFSGDTLLSNKHGQVRPPDPRLALDPAQALTSAERIKALPIKLLLTGHGAPVFMARD